MQHPENNINAKMTRSIFALLAILDERIFMSKLEVLLEKRNRLLQNGKNFERQGVIRKLDRKIRRLKKELNV